MSIRAMIHRWITDPWVADDPDPLPSQLDLIGGTYDIFHAALTRGTTVFGHTSLLAPPQRARAARHITERVVDQLRADLADDPDLCAQYEARFAGERGDLPAIRGALTGVHERDDRWLTFGRPTSDERYADGRGRDL